MSGLELIKHTVGGGVMTASGAGTVRLVKNGKIEFENATKISVDDCFSGEYDNYLIVAQVTCSANVSITYRMRANGNDNYTANSYVSQVIYADNGTVGGARTTANYGRVMGTFSTSTNGLHFYMYGPNLSSQPTAARGVAVSSYNSAYLIDYASTHNQSIAYDGFTFDTLDPGTFTGSLTIYGFTKQNVV